MDKIEELAKHLEVNKEDIEISSYNENLFILGKQEYLVLTDKEANEITKQYIRDSAWAFNASFIIEHSKLPYEAEEMLKSFQSAKCESANETVLALIEDFDTFVEDAISSDGRGHFLSQYDGEEIETQNYFIYRCN